MDNYEGAWETEQPPPGEDKFTKSVNQSSAAMPSWAYLGVAAGAVMLSLICQIIGSKWGNFISLWVPVWLIIGVYNKLSKLDDHDPTGRGHNRGYRS
jgi:hypothetical protein